MEDREGRLRPQPEGQGHLQGVPQYQHLANLKVPHTHLEGAVGIGRGMMIKSKL